MFLVLCPNCKNKMLYAPQKKVYGSKKKCVYCGKTFTIKGPKSDAIIKKIN